MATPKQPNGGGDGGPSNTAIEQQLELLSAIQVIKFTASPANVQPFQNTTISYQVKLPTNLKVPVAFSVGTQSFGHALSGSANFPVTVNTTFGLHAATAITGKNIATTAVTVDTAQCRSGAIAAVFIQAGLKSTIDQSFAGRLRGTGSIVTPGAGTISIQIPLNLDGQGTMDIDVELFARQNGQSVLVGDSSVTVGIHLNTDLNVGSWCSNAMAKIVQPFMQHIVDNELAPGLSQQIMGQINNLITSAQQGDHLHRTFELTSFVLNPDGATFMVCPTTPGIVVGGTHTIAEKAVTK
jgi:hypothetical protein